MAVNTSARRGVTVEQIERENQKAFVKLLSARLAKIRSKCEHKAPERGDPEFMGYCELALELAAAETLLAELSARALVSKTFPPRRNAGSDFDGWPA